MKVDLSYFIVQNDLVFDVGAHVGTKAQEYLRLGARVICFEPRWEACQSIWHLLGQNKDVMIVPVGMSSTVGVQALWHRSGQSSMSKRYQDHLPGTGPYLVPVITMDYAVAAWGVPAFVKLDVEDWEWEIISTMTCRPRAIQFEYHTMPGYDDKVHNIVDRLRSLDYTKFNYHFGDGSEYILEDWASPDAFLKDFDSKMEAWKTRVHFGDVWAVI